MNHRHLAAIGLLAFSVPLAAQDSSFERKAEGVLRQPLQDTGILKEEAAAVLRAAKKSPYSLAGMRSCANLMRGVRELDEVLGPDVDATDAKGEPLPANAFQEPAPCRAGLHHRGDLTRVSRRAG
jgi:hypothetical protein